MYRRGSPACAIGNQSDLARRNCVFGNAERIDDVIQLVDLIATWNSHPIMPITLLLFTNWHGSFAHEAVEPDIMALEPLIGG
jgi:hypothetical protein